MRYHFLIIAILGLLLFSGCSVSSEKNSSYAESQIFNSQVSENASIEETEAVNKTEEVEETETQIEDVTAPVFGDLPDIIIEIGDSIFYKENVIVTDDSGEEIAFEVDKSNVNTELPGEYIAIYTASDSAGNISSVERKIIILEKDTITEDDILPLADAVIAEVITEDMSD